MTTKQPLISVIIPAYNEQTDIRACLASLCSQSYKNLELIVIDDGSSDDTVEIIKEFPEVKLLHQQHQGPGAARNLGTAHAQGEILVFVDADMSFADDFIDNLTLPIRQGHTNGTFSKDEYVANMDNRWARAYTLVRGFVDGRMHPDNYPDHQPVFRAIKKSEFDRVGGFDSHRGYDDDWSLSERLGYQASVATDAKFYHTNPGTLTEIWHQGVWMGQRQYKYGMFGKLINLLRHNLVTSVVVGTHKSITNKFLPVLPVQIVVDLSVSWGIVKSLTNTQPKK